MCSVPGYVDGRFHLEGGSSTNSPTCDYWLAYQDCTPGWSRTASCTPLSRG